MKRPSGGVVFWLAYPVYLALVLGLAELGARAVDLDLRLLPRLLY